MWIVPGAFICLLLAPPPSFWGAEGIQGYVGTGGGGRRVGGEEADSSRSARELDVTKDSEVLQ